MSMVHFAMQVDELTIFMFPYVEPIRKL